MRQLFFRVLILQPAPKAGSIRFLVQGLHQEADGAEAVVA